MADGDDWHTVPEKTSKRPQRGRGGFQHSGGSGSSVDRTEFRNHQSRSNAGSRPPGGSEDSGSWRTAGSQPRRQPAGDSALNRNRSRPRPLAPQPAAASATAGAKADSSSFKLQTSNMFAVHVGKGSRARKNDDLKEFFETRDDDDGEEEAFDAIDDDDLDVSDYESEDDADEATSFPPMPVLIRCPFCPAHACQSTPPTDGAASAAAASYEGVAPTARPLITSAADLTSHLRDAHQLVFKHLNHMVLLLQRYLDAWAEKLATVEVAAVATKTEAAEDAGAVVYHIDAASCAEDKEIRDLVQKANLQDILQTQDNERRREALEPRKCLFCKHVCESRADLFRHGYREHNFNIGLHDNLVNVNEFLHILETKLASLQCLYCEKTFTSAAVLRKHMRKKKHFKISSHNRLYDRFYIVNYLEPGKSWEAIENEKTDSDAEEADRKDDSWNDWDDKADLPVVSLFDQHVASSVDECLDYMKREYGFDMLKVKASRALDFYKTVALVNMARRCTAKNTCFACCEKFDDAPALIAHFKQRGADHLQPPANDSPAWQDKDNLKPVIENDPLLMVFDDDIDGEEGDDEEAARKRLEECKKVLRKKLEQMSLSSTSETDSAVSSNQ
ncbi:hypothetical protein GGI04_003015 [Coemansia thaxteri]|uniref:C2H2-type domain-containing protein n=1 Tax=Coemansia thaxteri TaxID=2663907 RepID=A0A9W8BDB6_9FUNG|nr:hypothetical protein H4R26_003273 [Coemansia thaxteri]KAJ2003304.1 hypothetical protein GGI04_003015 [Coemansia thaxteri]KAJ2471203.1 hypothetical protein GGI02_002428 [Coemansia sp. RSA 2322]KAJ2482568.1 hypothetical protein EV174_003165 [Coemansia sp. RSA 2320]